MIPSVFLSPSLFDSRNQNPDQKLQKKSSFPDSTDSSDRIKVLIIASPLDLSIRKAVEALESEYQLYFASSSEQGIHYLKKDCPDIILCGHQKITIESLVESLKQAEFCDIPMILFSSQQEKSRSSMLLGNGVCDYLTDPYCPEELRFRLRNQLELFKVKKMMRAHSRAENQSLLELADATLMQKTELETQCRMKDEFFAILSHELRNPVNVIAGFAEVLLSEEETTPFAKKAADAIFRSAQHQVKLLSDLLDISKGIAGKIILDCQPMDLKTLIEESLPSLLPSAKAKNIKIDFTSDSRGGLIQGDSGRLSQVFWNLLNNAIKFTPPEGQIDVHLAQQDQWVTLTVQDNGSGIDPAFIPQMFERFHQQDSSVTKHFGGLGLGLAIVRHIVELHGGKVTAFSQGPGTGSLFTVQLPALSN